MQQQQKNATQPYADSITSQGSDLTITGETEEIVVEITITDANGHITVLRKCWDGQSWSDC